MLIGLSSPRTTRQPAARNAWSGCSRIERAAPVRTFEVGQTSIAIPSSAAQASVAGSSAMCEPCPIRVTPSVVDRLDGRGRRAGLGGVGGQPETGRRGDRVRLAVRRERREEQLVAGDVETDDALPGGGGGGPGDREVRLVVEVAEEADDEPDRQPGRLAAVVEALAGRRDDVGDREAGPGVGRRPEADLQEVAAVRGGVLDGLAGDAPHRVRRAEDRVGGGDVGEKDRQVGRPSSAGRRPSRRPASGTPIALARSAAVSGRTQPSRWVWRFRPIGG